MPRPSAANNETAGEDFLAIPVALGSSGVDLRDGRALRVPTALRELNNAQFLSDAEIRKRNGHIGSRVISNSPMPTLDQEEVSARRWLYGAGDWSPSNANQLVSGDHVVWPAATQLRGVLTLGETVAAWTGDRLLVETPGERWAGRSSFWSGTTADLGIPLMAPTVTAEDIDTRTVSITASDGAAGLVYEVLAYNYSAKVIRLEIRDRTTGSYVRRDLFITGANNTSDHLSVVYSAGYFVLIWNDTSNQLLFSAAAEADILTWSTPTQWASGQRFDMEVISDERFLVTWRDTNQLKIAYWRGNVRENAPAGSGTVLDTGAQTPNGAVACAVAPDGTIGVAWGSVGQSSVRLYTAGGSNFGTLNFITLDPPETVAITFAWQPDVAGGPRYIAFSQFLFGSDSVVQSAEGNKSGSGSNNSYFGCRLSTRAFRVGDVPMVVMHTAVSTSTFQSTHVLMANRVGVSGNRRARPIGTWSRGGAPGVLGVNRLCSVRPIPGQGYGIIPTTRYWHGSVLSLKLIPGEVSSLSPNVNRYDFLPPLRWAQFGRSTYIAGALVHAFDGDDVVEAGFIQYPEVTSVAPTNSGFATLAVGDIRAYRVYAVHRNVAGEVIRSPALTFTAPAITVGNDANIVTFTPIALTSRANVWFEVYATEGSGAGPGATFYLTSSSSAVFAPKNTPLAAPVTFTDIMSNSTLRTRPADTFVAPTGQDKEVINAALPNCTVIAGGRNRLYFAGGELPPGRIAHSKLRVPTLQAGWDDLAGYIDVATSGISSLAVTGDALLAFTPDEVLLVGGDGPNNLGKGSFQTAEVVAGAAGAEVHEGTAITEGGVVYWSAAGPRLISNSGGVVDISREVEPLTRTLTDTLTGVVVVPGNREVRWYTSTGTGLLWDHSPGQQPRWATWSGLPAAGAVRSATTGRGIVALNDLSGLVLFEDNDAGNDAGRHYEYSVWSGEIRPEGISQGNNEARRLAVIGDYRGPHTLHAWVYYDGCPMWRDNFTFNPSNQIAVQGWGSGTGTWNSDPTAWIDPATPSPDGVYRFRRRLLQQPCGTLSIRFSDGGANGDSVHLSEVAVEWAVGPGLTRTPPRTFSGPLILEG